jgi:tetraacyldisaccharide 4'-kinase
VFGKPILFGPAHAELRRDRRAFLARGAAVQVRLAAALEEGCPRAVALPAADPARGPTSARGGRPRARRGQPRRPRADATADVVRLLLEAGHRPAVLSRGYARTDPRDGVVVVSDGRQVLATVGASGDEPFMLARQLPGAAVLVSPDRYLAGRLAEHHLGCTVHVLDDGFQHHALERTGRSADRLGGGSSRPPAAGGRLREPLEAARAADAVLWTGGDDDPAAVAERLGIAAAFRLCRVPGPVQEIGFDTGVPEPGARVLALAGIARPTAFFRQLRDDGYDVAGELTFPDHHAYSRGDIARIRQALAQSRAGGVVTTEKDMVRLLAWRPLPFALVWRGVTAEVEPTDAFRSWLLDALQRPPARGRGASTA